MQIAAPFFHWHNMSKKIKFAVNKDCNTINFLDLAIEGNKITIWDIATEKNSHRFSNM